MGDTIVSVQFGITNPDDILKRSVVEVNTEKTHQSGQPVPNGVFDARFGVIENGKVCPTCKQTNQHCPGHFGHIRLARPVYLYQFFDTIVQICNVICLSCSKPLLPEETLKTFKSKGLARFREVRDSLSKRPKQCAFCNTQTFTKVTKVADKAATIEGNYTSTTEAPIAPVPLQPELVLRAFQHMTDEDIDLLGFSSKFSRPEWMICTILAVPPLTVRPSVMMDDHGRMEDDLTHKLIDILKHNDKLREMIEKGQTADIIDKYTATLQYHVATYVDNDIKGMAPSQQRSGRPLRTLKSRFGSKTGRVRGNLMGKRVDFSARSVITPDANIELDELGVPEEIAVNLTFPETVSAFNRERLLGYIRNGPDKHPGAKSVYIKRDDKPVSLRYVRADSIDLQEGDIVHRHLIDGDIVLFNRQPSLHKASMEAHRVRVLPYSTFRLNVSATRPYNADFDGDEMNMHVPQSIAAATELRQLASVLRQIISPRTASPIISVFQDTMTGVYRMSNPNFKIPEHIAMNMLAKINRTNIPRKNRDWTGPEIISMAFPLINLKTSITLENGQLTKGVLKKSAFTSGDDSSGLVQVLFNDFSPQRCGQMINDIQSIVTQFNLYTGFSVGTSDLIANGQTLKEVNEHIEKGRNKVAQILFDMHAGKFINNTGFSNGEKLEKDISAALNEVANEINKSVKTSLSEENRIVQMVSSGSKGSDNNITQMVALLGQQLIEGRRVQYTLQDRTLPHFARYDDGIESRGFIEHSFIDGLMPSEFFYHAQAGRIGLIDTAVKTSDTGYIQRRLMKTMEDQHIAYDNTVRNVTGTIVQFRYGEDGIDTTSIETQPFEFGKMTMAQIYADFALTADDVNPFLKDQVSEVDDLVNALLNDREIIVRNASRFKNLNTVQSPIHFPRLISKYANGYNTKTDLTPAYVNASIGKFISEFPENKVFHTLLRYNLAPKKSIIIHRLTVALFDELMRDIRHRYIKARCHPGEMIGALAAQSIGEPTTQLTLNTFHSTGTAKANATAGVPRIGELLDATKNTKRPSNTIYLLPEISGDQNEAIKKMKQIQKTTLRDITKSVRIFYDPNPSAEGTVIDEDRELLAMYQQYALQNEECKGAPWIMRIELDSMEQVKRDMLDLTLIQTKINKNPALKTLISCEHSDSAGKKIVLRLSFSETTTPVLMRYMEDKVLDTVLTGVEGVGRVHLREIKSELIYDGTVGGYVNKPQYVLDTEGINLYSLLVFPGVDGTRVFSNDIWEILKVFGIETARLAMYEELNEVFASEKVNYHHLSVLVDSMTFSGRLVAISRSGMKKNETGVFAKASFEETSTTMFNAALEAETDTMMGVSANIMFGQKPPCGTGFVDILVDEARLPEGAEEDIDTSVIDEVNAKLATKEESECRMEDILMDW